MKFDLTTIFFGLIAWIFANQIFMRWTDLWKRPALFWPMQVMNAGLGLAIAGLGLPGFPPWSTPTMVLGGMFVFRLVFNISQFQGYGREVRMAALAEQWERERDELERLRKLEAEAPPSDAGEPGPK